MLTKRYIKGNQTLDESMLTQMEPHNILKTLHIINPTNFIYYDYNSGGSNDIYIEHMFDLLNVPRNSVLHVDLFENGSKNVYAAFVSNMYGLDIGFNPINNTRTMLFNVKKYNENAPTDFTHVKFVVFYVNSIKNPYFAKYIKNMNAIEPKVNINNSFTFLKRKFKVDALLLHNFNVDECKTSHSIAGVTCDNELYMYNGWNKKTKDPGMIVGYKSVDACKLMKFDWMSSPNNFCLNSKDCTLDDSDGSNGLCFNVRNEQRYFAIAQDAGIDDINSIGVGNSPSPVSAKSDFDSSSSFKSANSANSGTRKCPPGKELNVATGRCRNIKSVKSAKVKECPPGKELNVATGRCRNIKSVYSVKSVKSAKVKECPPGKELNVATGRCRNIIRQL
jgi:hypothetical protein